MASRTRGREAAPQRRKVGAGTWVRELDGALRQAADPDRAIREKAYLKSPIEHYGVTVPAIRGAVKTTLATRGGLSHREMLEAVRRCVASRLGRMAGLTFREAV